jgi:hypothetical protein
LAQQILFKANFLPEEARTAARRPPTAAGGADAGEVRTTVAPAVIADADAVRTTVVSTTGGADAVRTTVVLTTVVLTTATETGLSRISRSRIAADSLRVSVQQHHICFVIGLVRIPYV